MDFEEFNQIDLHADEVVWIGFFCFISGIICNIIYYFIHPSHITADRFKDKLTLYVCGHQCCGRSTSNAFGNSNFFDEESLPLNTFLDRETQV